MNSHNNYIDIHSHILPGVDDGPGSMEQTIRMLHMAAEERITTIIATPHYVFGRKNHPVDVLRDIADQVQQQAYEIDKSFRIFLGNEINYSESVVEDLKEGKALTLAGSRYVLVEFPYGIDFKSMYHGMSKLIYSGYIPILAHVERYYLIHRKPDMVNELIRMGCYIQMNSNSIIGGLLNIKVSYNRKLLQKDMVHFISSDCHSDRVRVPIMQTAVNHLLRKFDDEHIDRIFIHNPTKILEDIYI